jgi:phosphatidylglycerol lysyltransferase
MKKTLKKLTPFISIVFFGLALWFLDQELRQYSFAEITGQLSEIPNLNILFSLLLCVLSYLLLTGYDALGVQYIGEKLEPSKIIRAGYVGYAFSHNIGLALITGGSIRYRIYSVWGFSGLQVTQIMAFSAFTLWIGFCAVGGLALLLATPDMPENVTTPYVSLRVLGVILLLMVISYVWACSKFKDQITFKDWSFKVPSLKMSLKQVFIASLDWMLVGSVLYVLLPESTISFFSFLGVFLLAQIIGLFSQVPGGLGVFESVMLLYLSNFMPGSQVLSILVVYRIIYYILPLLVALAVLGYQEYKVNRKAVKEFGEKAADWVPRVVPQVLSISVFVGGALLLFSGALPSEVPRMQWLQHFIPLPVIEMSHFFASLVGAALLVLAGALQRRVDGAYHLTVGLLIFGILFSLLKGADYEEASILAVMLAALVPCRDEFHRKTSLISQQFSARWFTMILIVLASAVWLGIFSFRHVEYQSELWWEFTLLGDAPRYLRATVAALGFAVIVGLVKLLRPKRRKADPKSKELDIAREILKTSPDSTSNLVLLRDKEIMLNRAQNAFVMYVKESRSWITLGDPVGPEQEAEEMIWKFTERCSNKNVWPVFYQVSSKYIDYYLDVGLTLFKLGEDARVNLSDFDIRQTVDKQVRTNCREMENSGYTWELLPPDTLNHYLPELKAISEASIHDQNRKERGFSVGYFDEEYLRNFPIAVVKKGERILAFSNILKGAARHELATDLLRYRPGSPDSIVDFMVTYTMLWGKQEGYAWYDLGIAPLSGMDEHDFSPSWNKLADFFYTYGESFYGFKAVREYKNRYSPIWEPKFLVCPGGLAHPGVLSNLTNVVSGGFSSLVSDT